MENENNNQDFSGQVIDEIKNADLKMRPRWHFILERSLFIIGFFIILGASFCLASFILFSLRQSGLWFAPEFGLRGWQTLFHFMPWALIVLSLLFLIILEILVRKFSFAYRRPLLYSLFGLLLIVILTGHFLVPWNQRLYSASRQNQVPFAGKIYRVFSPSQISGLRQGMIVSFIENVIVLEDENGATTTIIVGPNTRQPACDRLDVGNAIAVFGDEDDRQIQAYGIHCFR